MIPYSISKQKTTNKWRYSILCCVAIIIVLASNACKKDSISKELLVPVITTTIATDVKNTTAISGGTISNDNGSSIMAKGVCWSLSANPTIADTKTFDGNGIATFTSAITGLSRIKTYHIRAYATNANGTGYGNDITINTLGAQDVDGNIYNTVKIGDQEWMMENLRVSKFSNRDAVPKLSSIIDWSTRTTAAYCEYGNSSANSRIYGYLYNWYAITDARNIAPNGWRIPTNDDWVTLRNYFGSINALKESGTEHWLSANVDATNSSGFTALPGGYCNSSGRYYELQNWGCWWKYNATDASAFILTADPDEFLHIGFDKRDGYSIRCIKN